MGRKQVFDTKDDNKLTRAVDIMTNRVMDGYVPTINKVGNGMPEVINSTSRKDKVKNSKLIKQGQKPNEALITFGVYITEEDLQLISLSLHGRELNAYDRRVHFAICTLCDQGIMDMTLTQIYHRMGYKRSSDNKEMTKIRESVDKLRATHIIIDNKMESDLYNYAHITIDEYFLNADIIEMHLSKKMEACKSLNEQEKRDHYKALIKDYYKNTDINFRFPCEIIIHINKVPPLLRIAKQRDQYTTINLKLIQTPLYKTIDNLEIEEKFFRRYDRARNSFSIVLENFKEELDISPRKLKNVEKDLLRDLKYLKKEGFIKNYKKGKNRAGQRTYTITKQKVKNERARKSQQKKT